MKKTTNISFRLTEEEHMMFSKICDALLVEGEPYNKSLAFRRVLEDEYKMLKSKGLITSGVYQ